MTDSTLYIKFEKPDGDVVVLPAANREHYIDKGYKDVGRMHLEPGEMAPHESPSALGAVSEPEQPAPKAEPPKRK